MKIPADRVGTDGMGIAASVRPRFHTGGHTRHSVASGLLGGVTNAPRTYGIRQRALSLPSSPFVHLPIADALGKRRNGGMTKPLDWEPVFAANEFRLFEAGGDAEGEASLVNDGYPSFSILP
jgi:hypothetical protein